MHAGEARRRTSPRSGCRRVRVSRTRSIRWPRWVRVRELRCTAGAPYAHSGCGSDAGAASLAVVGWISAAHPPEPRPGPAARVHAGEARRRISPRSGCRRVRVSRTRSIRWPRWVRVRELRCTAGAPYAHSGCGSDAGAASLAVVGWISAAHPPEPRPGPTARLHAGLPQPRAFRVVIPAATTPPLHRPAAPGCRRRCGRRGCRWR